MTPGRPPPVPLGVAALYAWLRRHPGLVDGVLAAALAFLGLGQAIDLFRYSLIPLVLGLVVALAFRRKHPVAAFFTGIVVGLVQIPVGIRPNVTDLAIVILLYTLAAYTPAADLGHRAGRLPGRLGGGGARWTPDQPQRAGLDHRSARSCSPGRR